MTDLRIVWVACPNAELTGWEPWQPTDPVPAAHAHWLARRSRLIFRGHLIAVTPVGRRPLTPRGSS